MQRRWYLNDLAEEEGRDVGISKEPGGRENGQGRSGGGRGIGTLGPEIGQRGGIAHDGAKSRRARPRGGIGAPRLRPGEARSRRDPSLVASAHGGCRAIAAADGQ